VRVAPADQEVDFGIGDGASQASFDHLGF